MKLPYINIPQSILYDQSLTAEEKIVLSVIRLRTRNEDFDGCTDTNAEFASIVGKSEHAVSILLGGLVRKGLIVIEGRNQYRKIRFDENVKAALTKTTKPPLRNCKSRFDENVKAPYIYNDERNKKEILNKRKHEKF